MQTMGKFVIEILDDENTLCSVCDIFPARCTFAAEDFQREGARVPMCWGCAHAINVHGATLETAADVTECDCPDRLYYLDRDTSAEGN